MTHREQIELRGALMTSLAKNERLLQQIETLTFIIQQQIVEIEELCRQPSLPSSPAYKPNS